MTGGKRADLEKCGRGGGAALPQPSPPLVQTWFFGGLSNIPLSQFGGLLRGLRGACTRAVWLKMVFVHAHYDDKLRWLLPMKHTVHDQAG